MPGARWSDFRWGDKDELLAEFILSSIAFTTRVPRQEDIGYDFFCVLAQPDDRLLKAGPFFTVQNKGKREDIIYEKEHEVNWIKTQENPFFISVTNRKSLSVEIYSTWNMLSGFLAKKVNRIILSPGGPEDNYEEVQTDAQNSTQRIPLGRPILHITAEDAVCQERTAAFADILRDWVLMDRENLVHRYAEMYWVIGPTAWETNEPLWSHGEAYAFFFSNAENLAACRRNFGRCATALRIAIRKAFGQDQESIGELAREIEGVEHGLKSHAKYLEPLAAKILREHYHLDV